MKSNLILFFLAVILWSSCGDPGLTQTNGTQDINISIVFNRNISDNSDDPMPSTIKAFIQPVEGGLMPYIPKVTFYRLDLSKDSSSLFEMPMEAANSLRKRFGTYDYSNLKDDYTANLPDLPTGEYLTHRSGGKTSYTFLVSTDDVIYYLQMNKDSSNQDSILKDMRNLLIVKKEMPKRFVIFYDSPNSATIAKTVEPDSTTDPMRSNVVTGKLLGSHRAVFFKVKSINETKNRTPAALQDYLHELADPGVPEVKKNDIKATILNFFTSPDAEVIPVNNEWDTSTGMTIGKYVNSIIITHRMVTVVEIKPKYGTIDEIYISEK